MNDRDKLEENKLLELLEAVEAVLAHDDAEEKLGADTLGEFAYMRNFLRSWLRNESTLTHDQRVRILANFTDALAQKKLAVESIGVMWH